MWSLIFIGSWSQCCWYNRFEYNTIVLTANKTENIPMVHLKSIWAKWLSHPVFMNEMVCLLRELRSKLATWHSMDNLPECRRFSGHFETDARWLPFYRRHFHICFLFMQIVVFWFKFHWNLLPMVQWTRSQPPNNRQAIIWNNDAMFTEWYTRHLTSVGKGRYPWNGLCPCCYLFYGKYIEIWLNFSWIFFFIFQWS